jgi:regulator of replication initiation timing
VLEQEIQQYQQLTENLKKQIEAQTQENQLLQQQVQLLKEQVELYKVTTDAQKKEISSLKSKSFFSNVGSFGVGALIGAVLMVVL